MVYDIHRDSTRASTSITIIMNDTKEDQLAASLQAATLSNQQEPPKLVPHPRSIPATRTRSFTVKSVPTDAWVQVFADRIVLGVSQLDGKIGNFLLCQASSSAVNPRQVDFSVTNLLGAREDPLLAVYARRVTEQIIANRSPENTAPFPLVIVGISLDKEKGRDQEMFRLLVDLLVQLYREAVTGVQ
jgi:hypothetical protein